METLRALIRGDLAPVGNEISLRADLNAFSYSLPGYQACWVDSGTSALALALADAKHKAPQIKNPKVIIPGYCCPDLVAAAVYAGVRPLAVDIGEADAGYDLAALKAALDEDVLAVIAVNFLGIKDRLADIRKLLVNTHSKLIEDNAQWFPANASEQDFSSDYLLFTFGRGKPLSLLGGGVLFSRDTIAVPELVQPLAADPVNNLKQQFKLKAYNVLLHPRRYCYLNRAPFLHLGQTSYDALTGITALDSQRKALFSTNLRLLEARQKRVEQAYDGMPVLSRWQQLASIDTERRKRLLRYPLLCADPARRNDFLQQLTSEGLGASPMYQKAIDEIDGVDNLLDVAGDLKNARHFAQCFLTLPTHDYVSESHIQRIQSIFAAAP